MSQTMYLSGNPEEGKLVFESSTIQPTEVSEELQTAVINFFAAISAIDPQVFIDRLSAGEKLEFGMPEFDGNLPWQL